MPGTERSQVAELQRALVLSAPCSLLIGWALSVFGLISPIWVWMLLAVALLAYPSVLALELLLHAWVGRADSVAPARASALIRAWWLELRAGYRVFAWQQPFRWRELPDDEPDVSAHGARRAVVFVHGFACNRGFWLDWMRELREAGHPYVTVNLEPMLGSLDAYGALIEAAVNRAESFGRPPLIVCHSMGGMAARAWFAASPASRQRCAHIVTIASPHRGTWLARFGHSINARQMRCDSAWLRDLAQRERECWPHGGGEHFTCWYSNADNVVFPASLALLPGADHRFVEGMPHVALAMHPAVRADVRERLRALDRA